jgi:predicted phosphoribosyltransferase
MRDRPFRDRRHAGRVLAALLPATPGAVVLGLPRGGVPVAFEVARALSAPLDAFGVRKLGVPGHPELAMGAIASGGVLVRNDDVIRRLRVDEAAVDRVSAAEHRELARREAVFREGRPLVDVAGHVAIVVDDGLATGASMRAAVQALRLLGPARIVVAVPVAPQRTVVELAGEADDVVCARMPARFVAVGQAYRDFTQTTDDEVRELLRAARSAR